MNVMCRSMNVRIFVLVQVYVRVCLFECGYMSGMCDVESLSVRV